ncbi:MAG: cation:proton antiporter [Pseudomonadota bacterium]
MTEFLGSYLFYEIAALLALAAGVGLVGLLLRQPLIVSFIATGILAGPAALDIVRARDPVDLLAELGIAVLLFLVGLKLDLGMIRSVGTVAVVTGLGQVAFTTAFGFLIALGLGLDPITSLYIAVALTFSSTIIIVKLLSDKREIDSLHGRIALGFLIVQDLVVVLAMLVLSTLGAGAGVVGEAGSGEALATLGAGLGLVVGVMLFIRFVADPLVERLAGAPELLVSFAIGWAALLAALGHGLGFGKELGGLLAGVSLASTAYREAISSRLSGLRDFLLLFFFVALGASLDLAVLGDAVPQAIVLALFVLIGNPLIVLAIMGAMGYTRRTGFLAGLTVAQISEFSLVFMGLGVALGHVNDSALGLVTLVGLLTIAASTYMITYSHTLYALVDPLLRVFERRKTRPETLPGAAKAAPDVVVFGLGRYGLAVALSLRDAGRRVLGVDFSPVAVRHARAQGIDAVFGDATDPDYVAHLPLGLAGWAVSAVPTQGAALSHEDPGRTLLAALEAAGFEGRVALAAHDDRTAAAMAGDGVDLVLMPYRDAAARAAELVLGASLETPGPVPSDPDNQRSFAA